MKRISKIILLAFAISAYSCTTDTQGPLTYNGDKPQQVRIVNVENLAGGAKVFYSLPDDPNVLYILCEYVLPNGEKKVVKASTYTNYVQLEGFSKSISQEVNIYTVSRSEVSSEPVKVTIQPLDGRIHQVYETLQVKETFGGVNAVFLNPSQGELILYTLVKDNDGNWVTFDRLYTNSADRNYSVRGLDSEPTEFGFYFADKWNNRTDTLVKTLTPLYERMLDKKLWKNAKLLNDSYQPQLDVWMLENLWDSPGNGQLGGLYHGDHAEPGIEMPSWFTIDLGARYVFSRIRVNQMSHHPSFMFSGAAPQIFEIYGSNNTSQDGSWDSWTKLGTFESKKPSRSPLGILTDEDTRVAIAGEDFDFPVDNHSFRYIRFKTLRTYGGTYYIALAELTLWGQQVN